MTSLPDSVGNLQNLVSLWIFDNKLTSLPDSVGNLQNLRKLQLFNNQLTSLPDSVGNLQNLLELSFPTTDRHRCPICGTLTEFAQIYASNNTLTFYHETVGEIKSTKIVDLRRNTYLSCHRQLANG